MNKHTFSFLCLIGMLLFVFSCSDQKSDTMESAPGLDISLMDTTIAPSVDFFKYANGKWLQTTEIPSDRSRWGSFDELRKKSSEAVLEVLEEAIASKAYDTSTDQYKAAAFYQTAMDTTTANEKGISPLTKFFDDIANIKSLADVQDYNAKTIAMGGRTFFDFAVFPNLKNSTVNAAYLTSGSLGLPERDYYIGEDEDSKGIREDYVKHVAKMLTFTGIDQEFATKKAEGILALETNLAQAMLPKEERRNPLNLYNPRSIKELSEAVPAVDWANFIKEIGGGDMDSILVLEPKYTEALQATMTNTDLETIKDYMVWSELNNVAQYLSSDIEQANFDFYSTRLKGVEEMKPRWESVLDVTGGVMGEAIGKLYVDKHFPPEAKKKAADMVANIKEAMKDRINALEWMTDETKKKAQEKLANFTVKIGYPDKWEDYSSMGIKSSEDGGSYVENIYAAGQWNYEDQLSKLGKEVDKTEWGMPPQMVNAYYNPLNNEIVFPAAILQPPFYNYKADEAVNYGGIGAVIGHEISHGFDDQGSRFDAQGNMTNWWTDEDRESFDARNQRLIDQFDNYEPLPNVKVNGRFTLGENIGDLGGLNVAYDGLHKHFEKAGMPEKIDGFTADQRFFLSWATIWRTKMRNEELINRIKTDPHSPGMYRAIGPVSNMPAFYNAFGVKEGDPMYRADSVRVKIW